MNTLPDTHVREASRCPSPVTIWQTLLTRLLDQHYGARGLTCEADTLGSCGYVYMAVYPTPETKK